jgi:uncharacterized membrane protein (DUF373 family)
VVISIELYRLMVHYLRYHRVDLNILVEVGVSATIQKVILIGVDELSMQQLIGISLILVSLGAILWVEKRGSRRTLGLLFPSTEVRGLTRARARGEFGGSAKPPVMKGWR